MLVALGSPLAVLIMNGILARSTPTAHIHVFGFRGKIPFP